MITGILREPRFPIRRVETLSNACYPRYRSLRALENRQIQKLYAKRLGRYCREDSRARSTMDPSLPSAAGYSDALGFFGGREW